MSTRNRARPWFSNKPSLADIQRSAQLYYGWDDWDDPMTRLLDEANRRYVEHLRGCASVQIVGLCLQKS